MSKENSGPFMFITTMRFLRKFLPVLALMSLQGPLPLVDGGRGENKLALYCKSPSVTCEVNGRALLPETEVEETLYDSVVIQSESSESFDRTVLQSFKTRKLTLTVHLPTVYNDMFGM